MWAEILDGGFTHGPGPHETEWSVSWYWDEDTRTRDNKEAFKAAVRMVIESDTQ